MNHDELKEYINAQEPFFLKEARRKGYVCPVCGNGQGKDGDGITREPGKTRFHCFKCGLHEDVLGLIGKEYFLDDFKDCLEKGAELYGQTLEDTQRPAEHRAVKTPAQDRITTPAEPEQDYTEQYRQWNQAINEPGNAGLLYLQGRGLSLDIINRFKIGYVPAWKHPKTEKYDMIQATPRVIIPTGKGSYLARDIRPAEEISEDQRKYTKSKVNKVKLYNIGILDEAQGNVFVVEGEIDALSIIEAGGQAIGLGSASNKGAFLEYVKERNPAVTFTILPDNDDTGRKTAVELRDGLLDQGRKAYIIDLFDNCKDANDALVQDRDALARKIQEVNVDPAHYEEFTRGKTSSFLQGLVNRMASGVTATAVSTGFSDLDELLDGGLYEDLYMLMAGTGHGKTAFILQIADTIARTGRTVLFYNLELSNEELIARSISRETFQIAHFEERDDTLALSARDVTDVSRFKTFTNKQKKVFAEAVSRYKEYCDNIVFHEALGYYDTEKIDAEMDYYTKKDGQAPIVMVDYLQMLSLGITLNSERRNLTERQAVDKAIYDLKSVSRKYKTSVFVLSSMNRSAQEEDGNKEITQSAGKESGNIEYTAGTLMSLDYYNRSKFNAKEKNKNDAEVYSEVKEAKRVPRRMRIFIHKNRYGVPKQAVCLEYYSRNNFFFPPQNPERW